MARKSVLFVCIGNMCRSRMAEGMLAHFGSERYESNSCGVLASGNSRFAEAAQRALGIDPSEQWSKSWREATHLKPDIVIYLDASAKSQISPFPGAGEERDWFVDDPIEAWGSDEVVQAEYDRVRDLIYDRLAAELELDRYRED
jgi:arsenate reductase